MDGRTTKGAGPPPGDRFVEEHTGLVKSLAKKVATEIGIRPEEMDDLIAWGMQGLLEARERFDETRGVRFQTFAYYRIRGAILDGVRQMSHLPRRAIAKARALAGADLVGEEVGGRLDGARQAGARLDALATLDGAVQRIATAFLVAYQEETVEDERGTPEEQVERGEMAERLHEAMRSLPEREAVLLRGIYFENRTLEDIGAQIGVSRSWACRMHARALDRLREALAEAS